MGGTEHTKAAILLSQDGVALGNSLYDWDYKSDWTILRRSVGIYYSYSVLGSTRCMSSLDEEAPTEWSRRGLDLRFIRSEGLLERIQNFE